MVSKIQQMRKVKGCLLYKMITSQNVSFEASVKNFFISLKIYVPFFKMFKVLHFQPFPIYVPNL